MPRILRKQKPPTDIANYRQFKTYLRLDFGRRCAYCHQPEGLNLTHHYFGVEHFKPKTKFPSLICRYSNLLYACNRCNSIKGEHWPATPKGGRYLNPCRDHYEEHFSVEPETGRTVPRTAAGTYFCLHLRLDREELLLWRRQKTQLRRRIADLQNLIAHLDSDNTPKDDPMRRSIEETHSNFLSDLACYGDFWR